VIQSCHKTAFGTRPHRTTLQPVPCYKIPAMRKPPGRVRPIKGEYVEDVVTQSELNEISHLQAVEWQAARAAHRSIEKLERRLLEGASLEPGPLVFDRDLKMVRTRRKAPGSDGPRQHREKAGNDF
jgi:hypothetical protein